MNRFHDVLTDCDAAPEALEELLTRRRIDSAADLRNILCAVHERWFYQGGGGLTREDRFILTNRQAASILATDVRLRSAVREEGGTRWNEPYYFSNLGANFLPVAVESPIARDVISATEAIVSYLMQQGMERPYRGAEFCFRNPYVLVRDDMHSSTVEEHLSFIRPLLESWCWELLKVSARVRHRSRDFSHNSIDI